MYTKILNTCALIGVSFMALCLYFVFAQLLYYWAFDYADPVSIPTLNSITLATGIIGSSLLFIAFSAKIISNGIEEIREIKRNRNQ